MLTFLFLISPLIGLVTGITFLTETIRDHLRHKRQKNENKILSLAKAIKKNDPVPNNVLNYLHAEITQRVNTWESSYVKSEIWGWLAKGHATIANKKKFTKTDISFAQAVWYLHVIPEIKSGLKIENINSIVASQNSKKFREDFLFFWDKYKLDQLGKNSAPANQVWKFVSDIYHERLCPQITYKA